MYMYVNVHLMIIMTFRKLYMLLHVISFAEHNNNNNNTFSFLGCSVIT